MDDRQIPLRFRSEQKEARCVTCWKVRDELISAFRPRTRKTGNLPHLSYLLRKPKPLGTEFKCCADTGTGLLLCMEVQEGKEPMAKVSDSVTHPYTHTNLLSSFHFEHSERLCEKMGGNSRMHGSTCQNGKHEWSI